MHLHQNQRTGKIDSQIKINFHPEAPLHAVSSVIDAVDAFSFSHLKRSVLNVTFIEVGAAAGTRYLQFLTITYHKTIFIHFTYLSVDVWLQSTAIVIKYQAHKLSNHRPYLKLQTAVL